VRKDTAQRKRPARQAPNGRRSQSPMQEPLVFLLVFGCTIFAAGMGIRNWRLRSLVVNLEKEKTEAAAQAQAKRQTLFDGMREGVVLLDVGGRVEFVNLALRRMFGLTQDITGQTVREALQRSDFESLLDHAAKDGEALGTELELSEPVPRSLQINITAYVEADGRRAGTLMLFHDVTRLKQLENIRKEFVANVSHELRTPVSLIKGFAETLLAHDQVDQMEQKKWLKTIERHADRLNFLIEDLLTLSSLESGKAVMNMEQIQLWTLVERVREDLEARAQDRSILLENLLAPDLFAYADSNRLYQVLFNLVENAIKYGRVGGFARIGGKRLHEEKIEMWVQDDGPGIPLEARDRIFERFYRLDRARSRETGGTGLGLAIVKHIVQAHGGEVWVRSEVGQGTTFFFTLLPQESN
jgi:two-component system, OmpR family, phosphate regulon sensor histidine kinase PhoR